MKNLLTVVAALVCVICLRAQTRVPESTVTLESVGVDIRHGEPRLAGEWWYNRLVFVSECPMPSRPRYRTVYVGYNLVVDNYGYSYPDYRSGIYRSTDVDAGGLPAEFETVAAYTYIPPIMLNRWKIVQIKPSPRIQI